MITAFALTFNVAAIAVYIAASGYLVVQFARKEEVNKLWLLAFACCALGLQLEKTTAQPFCFTISPIGSGGAGIYIEQQPTAVIRSVRPRLSQPYTAIYIGVQLADHRQHAGTSACIPKPSITQ